MTPDALAAIRTRADAASDDIGIAYSIPADEWIIAGNKPTMQMLRHARADIPALLAEVDRLTHENERWGTAAADVLDAHDCGEAFNRAAREATRLREQMQRERAELMSVTAERDALAGKIEQLRSAIRLIQPDHITPQSASILNAALADPSDAPPCIVCGLPAMDALEQLRASKAKIERVETLLTLAETPPPADARLVAGAVSHPLAPAMIATSTIRAALTSPHLGTPDEP